MFITINDEYVYPVISIRQGFSKTSIENNSTGRIEMQIPINRLEDNNPLNLYRNLLPLLKDKEADIKVVVKVYRGEYSDQLCPEEINNSDQYQKIYQFSTNKGFNYFELMMNEGSGDYAENPLFTLYVDENDLI